jgi:hypothetical protein
MATIISEIPMELNGAVRDCITNLFLSCPVLLPSSFLP